MPLEGNIFSAFQLLSSRFEPGSSGSSWPVRSDMSPSWFHCVSVVHSPQQSQGIELRKCVPIALHSFEYCVWIFSSCVRNLRVLWRSIFGSVIFRRLCQRVPSPPVLEYLSLLFDACLPGLDPVV